MLREMQPTINESPRLPRQLMKLQGPRKHFQLDVLHSWGAASLYMWKATIPVYPELGLRRVSSSSRCRVIIYNHLSMIPGLGVRQRLGCFFSGFERVGVGADWSIPGCIDAGMSGVTLVDAPVRHHTRSFAYTAILLFVLSAVLCYNSLTSPLTKFILS